MVEVALADPDAPADALRLTCQRVLAANARQERIIDSLLTLAQGQRGLDQREPIDLEAVAGDVLAEREAALAEAGLRLEATTRRAPTFGDPRLVERLVTNLVENALVHNVPDGWVKVFTGLAGDRAVLRVSNSGPVIDATQIERLLRPFERFGDDRTGQRAGLGLAIVQAIAEAHGAVLTIEAPAPGGLQVAVSFPVRGASSAETAGVGRSRALAT
jgi:signal transduction histidine kinase